MTAAHEPNAAARGTVPTGPVTTEQLVADLRTLDVRERSTVMVHTSLRSLGWVVGGTQAVLEALREAVGPDGTLVMPTQSWQLSDPAFLQEAPAVWWPTIRDHLPLYDPATTPSQTMGAVAELFRTMPGAHRSSHPHRSITAVGPKRSASRPTIGSTHPQARSHPSALLSSSTRRYCSSA